MDDSLKKEAKTGIIWGAAILLFCGIGVYLGERYRLKTLHYHAGSVKAHPLFKPVDARDTGNSSDGLELPYKYRSPNPVPLGKPPCLQRASKPEQGGRCVRMMAGRIKFHYQNDT